MRLQYRTAAVLGVGSAIGRETALTFAREGAVVLAVDADGGAAGAVVDAVRAAGGDAVALAADVDEPDGATAVRDACEAAWGRLDVLFHGRSAMDFWDDGPGTPEDWSELLRVNVLAPVACVEALFPLLARSGSASVVFLGTVDGTLGNPELPAYSVTKGALVPLTHVLAHRGGPLGIRVNCIATAAISHLGPGDRHRSASGAGSPDRLVSMTPLGRLATPSDVATVALFFASDDAAYVTGTVLPVDGGRTACTPLRHDLLAGG